MDRQHSGDYLTLLMMAFLISCTAAKKLAPVPTETIAIQDTVPPVADSSDMHPAVDSFLLDLLRKHPAYFDSVLTNKKERNIQFIYTQVDRGANGIPVLKHFNFNLDSSRYFYPASTVKFPVSMLALQRLNELNIPGLDKNTTMITGQAYSGQTAVYNDPTNPVGKPSIAHYIKKILMVSDNDAFNRLYEFLGQQYINDNLHQKGYTEAQILHRLDIFLTPDENRHTNPVKFLGPDNDIIYQQEMQYNEKSYTQRNDSLGTGYYKEGQLINQPMDFSMKNRISLQDLHSILIGLVFPSKVTAAQRFNLTEEDRRFLFKYMSQLPTESSFPPYSADSANYWPAYCKFLLYGSEKGALPKNIRIFNKVGDAYGQLTDVAYIVDYDKKVEFFLSATINCNQDGILNDDQYDYEDTGFPFLKHLGEVIYDHELNRKKSILPDFSGFIFDFDKAVSSDNQ